MQARGEIEFTIYGKPEPGDLGQPEIIVEIGDKRFLFKVDAILTERISHIMSRIKLSIVGAEILPEPPW